MTKNELQVAIEQAFAPFTPSEQASAYIHWVVFGTGSAILIAVAGAGKTTVIIKGLPFMKGSVYVGCYNSKIGEEIKEKIKPLNLSNVRAGTMHSIGLYTWKRSNADAEVVQTKCRDIFRELFPKNEDFIGVDENDKQDADFESVTLKLVSLLKQAAVGVEGGLSRKPSAWKALMEHFELDTLNQDDRVINMAAKVLSESNKQCTKIIDFDDMLFAPLFFNSRAFQNDWVVIDEAQDTNAARRLLALKILKPGGRLVAVGDPHQAIYGFTGADADALQLIGAAKKAIELPLTVTYRCPKTVVAYAQQWVSHIQAHESAPEGVVRHLDAKIKLVDEVKPYDAILCRFNAPLVEAVYQFIAKGVPAKIEGREIGEGLKQVAKRWKVKSFDAFLNRLDTYETKEVAKYAKKEEPTRVQAVQDKCACLRVLVQRTIESGYQGDCIKALCAQIDSIFADQVNGGHVVLTSIHKSKGREWNRVFWIQGQSSAAKQPWEIEQEKNLCYVAATRAKAELVLVPQAPKKSTKK